MKSIYSITLLALGALSALASRGLDSQCAGPNVNALSDNDIYGADQYYSPDTVCVADSVIEVDDDIYAIVDTVAVSDEAQQEVSDEIIAARRFYNATTGGSRKTWGLIGRLFGSPIYFLVSVPNSTGFDDSMVNTPGGDNLIVGGWTDEHQEIISPVIAQIMPDGMIRAGFSTPPLRGVYRLLPGRTADNGSVLFYCSFTPLGGDEAEQFVMKAEIIE